MKDETLIQSICRGSSDSDICLSRMGYYFRDWSTFWSPPTEEYNARTFYNKLIADGFVNNGVVAESKKKPRRHWNYDFHANTKTWKLTKEMVAIYLCVDQDSHQFCIQVGFDEQPFRFNANMDCDALIALTKRTIGIWKETKSRCEKLRKKVEVGTATIDAIIHKMLTTHTWDYSLQKSGSRRWLLIKLSNRRYITFYIAPTLTIEQMSKLAEDIDSIIAHAESISHLIPEIKPCKNGMEWVTANPAKDEQC